jgi:hypothetical protein
MKFFDEFHRVINISKNKIDDWNTNLIKAFERWSRVFEFVQSEGTSLENIHIVAVGE